MCLLKTRFFTLVDCICIRLSQVTAIERNIRPIAVTCDFMQTSTPTVAGPRGYGCFRSLDYQPANFNGYLVDTYTYHNKLTMSNNNLYLLR